MPFTHCASPGILLLMVAMWLVTVAGVCASSTNTPAAIQLAAAIDRGVQFLVGDQNPDGSWGSPEKTKDLNVYAPIPGAHHAFRAAVTAMCVEALLDAGAADDERASNALARAEAWLVVNLPKVRRADGVAIYNVWTHAYGIQAIAAMHGREKNPARRKLLKRLIEGQIELLRQYESVDGGWGYYDNRIGAQRPASSSTSFVTATVLLALRHAREVGVTVPADMTRRAVDSLKRQQKNDFSYVYGEYLRHRPMLEVNRPAGSLGRSQACNLALRFWGATNVIDSVMTEWLDRFVTRNEWLGFARKRPVPHESWFMVAGYFFYYGHYHAALVTQQLPGQNAAKYQAQIAAILLPLQEKDGSWWDFPLYNYHQQYGTAFALMTLTRCRPSTPVLHVSQAAP